MKKKDYFEGWYFKHVSADRKQVWSFIPGISLTRGRRHAFIQVLNGMTGESQLHEYDIAVFSASGKELDLTLGRSSFSTQGISLGIKNEAHQISGSVSYASPELYPSTLINPGIMGWYSFVPFMECKHGVVSMHHELSGGLEIDGQFVDFEGGTGYIEKDWGSSFPESWIWLHCNTFNKSKSSFTFSVAKIPWLGSYFIGFISYLKLEGRFINFSTWSKARIEKLEYLNSKLSIRISNKKYLLEIEAVNNQAGQLKAPVLGNMTRIIKETVDATLELKLSDHSGNILFEDQGSRAGMELIEKILEYFS
ncbi:MAG: tocopherol cyclase family protein [Candidatus Bathyarchaeota archaeon]|nr:tocopherol cyclase family protein [Candidatus Bathyarchaeota archaeon]